MNFPIFISFLYAFEKFRDQQSAQIKLNDANVKEKLTADKSINFVIHGFQSGLKEGIYLAFIERTLLIGCLKCGPNILV